MVVVLAVCETDTFPDRDILLDTVELRVARMDGLPLVDPLELRDGGALRLEVGLTVPDALGFIDREPLAELVGLREALGLAEPVPETLLVLDAKTLREPVEEAVELRLVDADCV